MENLTSEKLETLFQDSLISVGDCNSQNVNAIFSGLKEAEGKDCRLKFFEKIRPSIQAKAWGVEQSKAEEDVNQLLRLVVRAYINDLKEGRIFANSDEILETEKLFNIVIEEFSLKIIDTVFTVQQRIAHVNGGFLNKMEDFVAGGNLQ